MGKIDAIKEFIGFLKSIFITLVVIDSSLIAWVFKTYILHQKIDIFGVLVLGVIFIISGGVVFLFIKILKEIKKLGRL